MRSHATRSIFFVSGSMSCNLSAQLRALATLSLAPSGDRIPCFPTPSFVLLGLVITQASVPHASSTISSKRQGAKTSKSSPCPGTPLPSHQDKCQMSTNEKYQRFFLRQAFPSRSLGPSFMSPSTSSVSRAFRNTGTIRPKICPTATSAPKPLTPQNFWAPGGPQRRTFSIPFDLFRLVRAKDSSKFKPGGMGR